MHPHLLRIALATALLLVPAAAQAQDIPVTMAAQPPPVRSAPPWPRTLFLSGAYGIAQSINRSAADSDIASGWLGITWRLRGHVMGAEPSLGLEASPAILVQQEPRAHAVGWRLLYEQRWSPRAAVHPFLGFGAGMMWADVEVPPGETRQNFTLFVGTGLEFDLGPRTLFRVAYRLHHVSNADAGPRNPGINAHTLVLTLGGRF